MASQTDTLLNPNVDVTEPTDEISPRRRRLLDWLDDRTSYRRVVERVRQRELPDGPKWAYTPASVLLWLTVVQIFTGFLLMATYSPSLSTAWASVHFIEQSTAGSFLRGVHFYAAQAMIALFFVHIVRVLLSRAYHAPRELVWVTGLFLVPLVLVWTVTGNPLSGSQRGVSQIDVEGNILGSTPLIGPRLQAILIGGESVGNLTLTHLYFLHVALMPVLAIGLLAIHLWQVRRHGLSGEPPVPTGPRMKYWPHQSVRNMVALTVVLGVIAFLAATKGAPLDVPADPEIEHMPRPEWYFLSLFELRRYFTGHWEIIATAVIPGAVLLLLICLPLIDRAFSPRAGRMLRGSLVGIGCGVWLWLTGASLLRDHRDAEFQASEAKLAVLSARARELADAQGVPVEGAATLLKNDAQTQGPRLFARHCAGCHPHQDANGQGIAAGEVSAPNLFGFGTRTWIEGMLDPQRIASDHGFGKTKFADGDMVGFVKSTFDGASDDAAKKTLAEQMKKIAATLAAEAALPAHKDNDARDQSLIAEGATLLKNDLGCADCHKFHDAGDLGSAPDLTGYASRAWLIGMISNPQHERFYAGDRNDRMPAFVVDPANANGNLLTPRELDLLVDWLRGE